MSLTQQLEEDPRIAPDEPARDEPSPTRSAINVGNIERLASASVGAAMISFGLYRRSIGGAVVALVGGALALRGATGQCGLYRRLGIDTARSSAEPEDFFERGIHVDQAFTVQKPPAELYQFWRKLENLPSFMSHLDAVTAMDDKRSHWTARGPAGMHVEWDAEIINDEPDTLIAWKSLDGADVDHRGSVRFIPAPEDRGTEVRVVMEYIPPAGQIGHAVARLFGADPNARIREDLRRFKQLMETGEIATIEGQPRGTCSR